MRNPVLVSRWWLVVVARSAFGCLLGCAVRSSWAVRGRFGWGRLRAVFVALVVSLCVVVAAAPASAYIYWATPHRTGTIGRANLDGTDVNQSFITGATPVRGGGRRAAHLLDQRLGNSIGRANLDGSDVNQSFITGATARWGGGRRPAHLLDELRHRHDRAGEPRRHRRQPELHHRRSRPRRAWRSTASTSTGPTPDRHDRAGEPRRHRRQPELHHGRRASRRGGGRRAAHLLDERRPTARSGGRTSTAPASTRASSRAPRPVGWRSTATYLLGATAHGTIGRANLDGTGVHGFVDTLT